MKKYKTKEYLFASAFSLLALCSCNVPEDPTLERFEVSEVTNPETITQHIIANPELNLFERALRTFENAPGNNLKILSILNLPGNTTVFAPSDSALNDFLASNELTRVEDIPVNDLRDLFSNQLLSVEIKSSDLNTGYIKTNALESYTLVDGSIIIENTSAYINNDENGISINRDTNIITSDIDANNGVIHIVDKTISEGTVASLIGVNPNISNYLALVRHADTYIREDNTTPEEERFLRRDSDKTVFVPSNEAINSFFADQGLTAETFQENLESISPENALRIIRGHQLNAHVIVDSISNSLIDSRVDSSPLSIVRNIESNSTTITDSKGGVANVISPNIHAPNGIIYLIDKVLLPADEVEDEVTQ